MRRAVSVVGLVGVAMAMTACGDGGSDDPSALAGEDGVKGVTQQYLSGIATGDGARACSVLDAPSQQALVALQGVSGNCLEAVKAASASLSSAQKASLEDADIDVVDAGDERGEAKVALADAVAAVVGTGEGVISLTRTQGHWEITLGIPPG